MTFDEIARAVRKLDPEERPTGDLQLLVKCRCGTLLGRTKVSQKRGGHKDAGPDIVAQIPRQLKIERPLWNDIASCTKGRADYVASFIEHAAHELRSS